MKALIITSRFPWPPYTGDRLRASIWIAALARCGEVTLIAPAGAPPDDLPPFRFVAARRSLLPFVKGMLSLLRHRLPLQCLMSAPYDWRNAVVRARQASGPFDVTVVILSRMHPWLKKS